MPADREWPDTSARQAAIDAVQEEFDERGLGEADLIVDVILAAAVEASPVFPAAEYERVLKLVEPKAWLGWEQVDSIYDEARLLRRERDEARAALAASVPVPPCPTCEGSGETFFPGGHERPIGHQTGPCRSCKGSGRDRLIPESEIRAWVADNWRGFGPLDEFTAWLDERGER